MQRAGERFDVVSIALDPDKPAIVLTYKVDSSGKSFPSPFSHSPHTGTHANRSHERPAQEANQDAKPTGFEVIS